MFTTTNEVASNRVLAFAVNPEGTLGEVASYATGGVGSGDSLGSQGALVLSEDRRFLIAVNAGSDDVSVFEVHGAELDLRQRVSSGGKRPISVTERGRLVYVVNAGSNDVAGFSLDPNGELAPIAGSTRPLSGGAAGPAQIALSPDASALIVTEKTRNVITLFGVETSGQLSEPTATVSEGTTPFGFEFKQRGELVVSEAATGSLSSYAVAATGVAAISSAVPDTQQAACWVAFSPDDRFAFTTNAASASISSYTVSSTGELALHNAVAANLGAGGTP
ncbi:MAG: beta-propeller fold lactonase family protein, partial [Polyangiales bacterium]